MTGVIKEDEEHFANFSDLLLPVTEYLVAAKCYSSREVRETHMGWDSIGVDRCSKAIDHVKKAPDNSYDVIVVDSTDPLPGSVAEVLFSEDFYENCYRILSPNGCISTQALMPMRYDAKIFKQSMHNIQHAFTKEKLYVYFGPTDAYGGVTAFCLGFKGDAHPDKIDKARITEFEKEQKLKYYNYKMHHASLTLPNYIRDILYD